jgi:hypothetical protein
MIRVVLTIVLPLLLPTLLFAGYVLVMRWRTPEGRTPESRPFPWTLLILSGVGLAALAAIATAVSSGAPPNSTYVPAHMENGRLVPGEMRPPESGR